MAHNINRTNGKDSFFSVKQKAWHGLGLVLDNCPTSEEAIKFAGLDYEVGLAKLYAQVGELGGFEKIPVDVNDMLRVKDKTNNSFYSRAKEIKDRFATYRKDTNIPFGIVGSRYEVIQNVEAFNFFDDIVGKGEAIYETAGALGKGETIFITAKMPDFIKVKKEDIEKYLLLTMSHDGTSSITAMFTPVRVVCNNTLSAALERGGNKVTIRHTKSAKEKLAAAAQILGIANQLTIELGEVFNIMSNIDFDNSFHRENCRKSYISQVLLTSQELKLLAMADNITNWYGIDNNNQYVLSTRKRNMLEEVEKYTLEGCGQQTETTEGTLYGLYNGITGYFQNVKSFNNAEDKFASNIMGANSIIMEKSLNVALNYLKS